MFRRSVPVLLAIVAVVAVAVSGVAIMAPARGDAPPARHDPVLLVHGFDGSERSWRVMESRLRDAHYRDDEVEAISYDSTAPNTEIAAEIGAAVKALRRRTGATRVDVVSHSMGAIASRFYVEHLGGDAWVDAWVSLAGVNGGTVWGYGCAFFASCRDMIPGSSVLDDLARSFRPDASVRFGAWWSPCDLTIVPSSGATLAGARNTETACIGHSELKTDRKVFAQVLRFVGARHRG